MFVDYGEQNTLFEKLIKDPCDEQHSNEFTPGCVGRNRNGDSSATSSGKRNLYQYYKTRTTQRPCRASKTSPSTQPRNSRVQLHG